MSSDRPKWMGARLLDSQRLNLYPYGRNNPRRVFDANGINMRTSAFRTRNRFMGYVARVMRGLIIDYTWNRRAQKRNGQ